MHAKDGTRGRRERAALAWTEAVTVISAGVPDELYESVREHFNEKERLRSFSPAKELVLARRARLVEVLLRRATCDHARMRGRNAC